MRRLTRRERHRRLVKREKQAKRSNTCWFGMELRSAVLREMRRAGRTKRARHARLLKRLNKQDDKWKFTATMKTREMLEKEPVIM